MWEGTGIVSLAEARALAADDELAMPFTLALFLDVAERNAAAFERCQMP